MPTITSGQSVEVLTEANKSYYVTGNGTARVVTGTSTVLSLSVNGTSAVIQPLGVDSTLLIAAVGGSLTYDEYARNAAGVVIYGTSGPINSDGEPDGTVYLKVSP